MSQFGIGEWNDGENNGNQERKITFEYEDINLCDIQFMKN